MSGGLISKDRGGRVAVGLVLGVGALAACAQAFLPIGEFVQRGDDAYYYFKVAANLPRVGFWSFDGVEPTNGVQPLWAMILSAVAAVAAAAGLHDPDRLARLFVLTAAVLHVASAVVLLRFLSRQVSLLCGVAAAGAWLLTPSFVWGRLWGLEAPLLALTLLAANSWYLDRVRRNGTLGAAAILGLLLGLVCLSRLNAGLFIPILLGAHLIDRGAGPLKDRLSAAVVAGAAASALVLPYLGWNLATTGALLPVSGVVKTIGVHTALHDWAGAAANSLGARVSFMLKLWPPTIRWFVTSRVLDGLWLSGVRLVREGMVSELGFVALVGTVALGPAVLGPVRWLAFLCSRAARLWPCWPFAAFALVDAAVSVGVYPTQTYAIARWWLVAAEIVLTVSAALLVSAAAGFIGDRLGSDERRRRWVRGAGLAGLSALVLASAAQSAWLFWSPVQPRRDWNQSWGDEAYRATLWMNANLPADAAIGSWNAGVVGYYSSRRVINLDGLINNAAILPYLRADRIDRYILDRKIGYLSDLDRAGLFQLHLGGRLKLTPVYVHHSSFGQANYYVYRVDGPAPGAPP